MESQLIGALISVLLTILVGIGVYMLRELRDLGTKVENHGLQLASINTTLKHFERRKELLGSD